MTNSTEVVQREQSTLDVTSTREVEAHTIAAQSTLLLATALVEVYARTEGLPLSPVRSWFVHPGLKPSISGYMETDHRALAHVQRQRLAEWATALDAEVVESRSYSNKVQLTATTVLCGIPVSVQVDVDHYCTCTGQCRGDSL